MTGYTEAEEKELEKLSEDLRALSKKYEQNGIVNGAAYIRQFLCFGIMSVLDQPIPLQNKIHFLEDTIEEIFNVYAKDVVL